MIDRQINRWNNIDSMPTFVLSAIFIQSRCVTPLIKHSILTSAAWILLSILVVLQQCILVKVLVLMCISITIVFGICLSFSMDNIRTYNLNQLCLVLIFRSSPLCMLTQRYLNWNTMLKKKKVCPMLNLHSFHFLTTTITSDFVESIFIQFLFRLAFHIFTTLFGISHLHMLISLEHYPLKVSTSCLYCLIHKEDA